MVSGKRCKNFTEREKMLLMTVATEFITIIENKRTDASAVEAKKRAWMRLTNKYNSESETGFRTEKQLHALYDNLKKRARKIIRGVKGEIYETGSGTFIHSTTAIDEKILALLTPQFKALHNDCDSSAPYYNLGTEVHSDTHVKTDNSQDILVTIQDAKKLEPVTEIQTSSPPVCQKRENAPPNNDVENTSKKKRISLIEIKKKNVNYIRSLLRKIRNQKEINENAITAKKLEILEIQRQHEIMKSEKTEILLDIDIELKKLLLKNAELDLEIKKKNFSL